MLSWLVGLLRPSKPPENPAYEPSRALRELVDELDTLRAEVKRLRGEHEQIALDWASTLQRIGQWASRQAAREQRAAARALEAATTDAPVQDPTQLSLTDDPRRMSKQQLRALVASRRNGK